MIGSGIAGLRAAIALADVGRVTVLTKADPLESNTGYAQGGIAVAIGADDSSARHVQDTVMAGDGLCRADAVRVLVAEGPRYVHELLDWGTCFDRDAFGAPALGREAAHSARRVLHARDATGREIGRVLWMKVAAHPQVTVLDDALAFELVVRKGVCHGALFLDREGRSRRVEARCTLIATGGAGQVYRETTNPRIASGDGLAMAAEAGARVTDLEFVQFHPTVLSVEGRPRFLLSEALRGEGAYLVNASGERFVLRDHEARELAPRDLLARSIAREQTRTGAPVMLSMAHLDSGFVRERFPTITRACRDVGLDLARDPIPVSPAAHYVMGGIETDLDGRTSIEGLFAAGEAACTGVHGANRLASHSLLEGLVFGARAAAAMTGTWVAPAPMGPLAGEEMPPGHDTVVPSERDVRDLMWTHVGVTRTGADLSASVLMLANWRTALLASARSEGQALRDHRRLSSLTTVGYLIARAALRREESRGGHYRSDFPVRDDIHWRVHMADRLEPVDRPTYRA